MISINNIDYLHYIFSYFFIHGRMGEWIDIYYKYYVLVSLNIYFHFLIHGWMGEWVNIY